MIAQETVNYVGDAHGIFEYGDCGRFSCKSPISEKYFRRKMDLCFCFGTADYRANIIDGGTETLGDGPDDAGSVYADGGNACGEYAAFDGRAGRSRWENIV